MDTKTQLNALLDSLTELLSDADKFDAGNDSAGRRLRAGLLELRNSCTDLRKSVQDARNNRKSKE